VIIGKSKAAARRVGWKLRGFLENSNVLGRPAFNLAKTAQVLVVASMPRSRQ
jgi:hypothetical protein